MCIWVSCGSASDPSGLVQTCFSESGHAVWLWPLNWHLAGSHSLCQDNEISALRHLRLMVLNLNGGHWYNNMFVLIQCTVNRVIVKHMWVTWSNMKYLRSFMLHFLIMNKLSSIELVKAFNSGSIISALSKSHISVQCGSLLSPAVIVIAWLARTLFWRTWPGCHIRSFNLFPDKYAIATNWCPQNIVLRPAACKT